MNRRSDLAGIVGARLRVGRSCLGVRPRRPVVVQPAEDVDEGAVSCAPGIAHWPLTTKVGTAEIPCSAACSSLARPRRDRRPTSRNADHVVAVEPDLGGAVGQRVGVADVEPVDEVGLQQPLLQDRLGDRRAGCSASQSSRWARRVLARSARSSRNVEAVAGGGLGDVVDDRGRPARARRTCGRRPRRPVAIARAMRSGRAGRAGTRPRTRPHPRAPRRPARSGACRCSTTGTRRRTRSRPESVGALMVINPTTLISSGRMTGSAIGERQRDRLRDAGRRVDPMRRRACGRGTRIAEHADGARARRRARNSPSTSCTTSGSRRSWRSASGSTGCRRCCCARAAPRRSNFHPAVVEAGLSDVPMIVVTADRPPGAAGDRLAADDRPARTVRTLGPVVPRRRGSRRGRAVVVATARAAGVLDGGDRPGPSQPAVP